MSDKTPTELRNKLIYGVRKGVAQAILQHKNAGHYIVIWKDGKVVKVPPEEIEVPYDYLNKNYDEFSKNSSP